MGWAKFWQLILPELLRLARELYADHKADPEKAVGEVKRIRQYRKGWDENRAKNRALLEADELQQGDADPPAAEAPRASDEPEAPATEQE
jgi:hypothetical protein